MTTFAVRALLASCVLCLAGCWTPREQFPPMHPMWQVFSAPQARHSVDFPGHSKERVQETALSGQKVSTYLREVEVDGRYFGTAWTLVPGDTSSQASRDGILEIAAAEALKSSAGKLVSKHAVTLEGNRGLAYVIDMPQSGIRLRQQLFVVTGVLVEQTYTGPAGTEDQRTAGRFFDSLQLLP
jgi:hypothetical protein